MTHPALRDGERSLQHTQQGLLTYLQFRVLSESRKSELYSKNHPLYMNYTIDMRASVEALRPLRITLCSKVMAKL